MRDFYDFVDDMFLVLLKLNISNDLMNHRYQDYYKLMVRTYRLKNDNY